MEGESGDGEHGGTSVFEFSGAEEGSGCLRSVFAGELVPVVFADEYWFAAEWGGSEAWDFLLYFEELAFGVEGGSGWSLGGRGGECSSRSDEEGEDGEFHGDGKVFKI